MTKRWGGVILALVTSCSASAPAPPVAPAPSAPAPPAKEAPAPEPPPPSKELERITPAEAGIDETALEALLEEAKTTRSDAVVILRHGKLVGEWLFDQPREPIEAMSATKSVVSMIAGRALTLGAFETLDTPAHRYFESWKDGAHAAITLRHLLDNRSGLQANKTTEKIYASKDFVQFALEAEVETTPGEVFKYNNKAFNLVPALVARATKRPFEAFVKAELFGPLGIEDWTWTKDGAGNPHGMAGLQIHAVDLAKLGQLMLDGGTHRGERLLAADFVQASRTPPPGRSNYALGWWLWGDYELYIDEGLVEAWREMGVAEDFLAIVKPMVGKRFDKKTYFAELKTLFEGKGGIERWYDNTWRKGRPDARTKLKEILGFNANGFLGQYVVVDPKRQLVAVRMRRWSSGGNDQALGFKDFPKRVGALVPLK